MDYDNQGNVYAYGGVGPFELMKYDSTGALVWTYTSPFLYNLQYYGDFAVDRNSNNIYLVEGFNTGTGAQAVKINSSASQLATFGGNPQLREMWRIAIGKCNDNIIIAGGGTSSPSYQTCYLDTNLVATTPVQYIPTTDCCHDAGLLALDNYGNAYELTSRRSGDTIFNNTLVKLPVPALSPIIYRVPSYYATKEASSMLYYQSAGASSSNGFNGITTSGTFVYTYDGYVLKKWDGPTGNLLVYKRISYPQSGDSASIYWGGLSADDCGNLFLANDMYVQQYDANLNLVNTYTMPGSITDVNISNSGTLYVCGQGFLSAISPSNIINCQNSGTISLTATTINETCTTPGAATTVVSGGNPPYNIVWNTIPPQYGFNIFNVPAGVYIATITGSGCHSQAVQDTVTIGSAGGIMATSNSSNATCGNNDGTATCTVTAGNPPYSYLWSDGQTAQTATGLSVGVYTCIITDSIGCISTRTVNINSVNTVSLSYTTTPTVCNSNNGSATINATGGNAPYSYLWSNGQTTQTANNFASGICYCVVTDSVGCAQLQYITIVSSNPLSFSITTTPSNCVLNTGTATVVANNGIPPYSYSWSNGQDSVTATGLALGLVTCTVTDSNGCVETQSTIIPQYTYSTVTQSTLGNPHYICNTPFLLTGGSPAGGAYSGDGVSSNIFNPSVAGLGSHTITYSYTEPNGCVAYAYVTIFVVACSTVGINENNNLNNVTISPNPFTSQTTISFSEEHTSAGSATHTIIITDVLGKEIKTTILSGARNLIIEKGEMSNGIYFVRIETTDASTGSATNVVNRKIVVQ